MVGYSLDVDYALALDVCYGIEEEGCLPEMFEFKNISDISDVTSMAAQLLNRSLTGVAVSIYAGEAEIHCVELKDERSLLRVFSESLSDYRRLGKNAARYLKNKKLEII